MAIPWGLPSTIAPSAASSSAAAAGTAGLTDAQKLKALEDKFDAWQKRVQSVEAGDRRYAGGRLASIDLQQAQRAMMRSGGSINAAETAFRDREHWFRQATRSSSVDVPGALSGNARTAYGNGFKTGW